MRTCEACGPIWLASAVEEFGGALVETGQPVHGCTVRSAAWRSLRERLGAAGAVYVRCPQGDGSDVVFSTLPSAGDLVADPRAALAAALAGCPAAERRRVSASRSLRPHPVEEQTPAEVVEAEVQGDEQEGQGVGHGGAPRSITWAFAVSLARFLAITAEMGFLGRSHPCRPGGRVVGRWDLNLPPEGSPEFRRWARRVGRFDASDPEARRRTIARDPAAGRRSSRRSTVVEPGPFDDEAVAA